jgi:XTP/dITP diphosphohydrolase
MPENGENGGFGHTALRRRIYLASNNRHKQQELSALTAGLATAFDVRLARDLRSGIAWDETGASFVENAMIKATVVKAHTDACVLADDSGLVVDALDGAPGVYSSRYAGREGDDDANNAKLLAALAGVPLPRRSARFVCTLVFIDEGGRMQSFVGECRGHVALAPRGTHGFGYDPLFVVEGRGLTMAELDAAAKNAVSHRARAVQAWIASL